MPTRLGAGTLAFGLATASLLAMPLAAQAQAAGAPTVFRISHQLPPAHHIAKLVQDFAADVKTRTNGRVEVQIFGADQLFKPDQNHPAVARREVEGALSVNFQWGNTIPELNVMTIPFYFTDLEKIRKFPGSELATLLESKLEARGVKNIAWFYTTRQSIFTSSHRPLVSLDDFKGTKIRGLNKLVDQSLLAVGAAPAAMPGSEVYQALQTRVIDAGLTDVSAAYSRKFYEVQKFGTVSPFFTVYFHLYVNPAWWNGLPADQRSAIAAAAKKAEQDAIPLTEETAKAAIGQLRAAGMQLHLQTPQEARTWADAMQKPVLDSFMKSSPDAQKVISATEKL
jgi:TRAP-type C4-dicarboxylate transport system substrate-binding protein